MDLKVISKNKRGQSGTKNNFSSALSKPTKPSYTPSQRVTPSNNKNYKHQYYHKNQNLNRNSHYQDLKKCKIPCEMPNCSNQVFYFAKKPNEQQFAFCSSCVYKNNLQCYYQLRPIPKSNQNKHPETTELFQKLQSSSDNISKVLINLDNYKRYFYSEIQYELFEHNAYYDTMCEIIQKKKEKAKKEIQVKINQMENQFKIIKDKIMSKKCQIQNLFKMTYNLNSQSSAQNNQIKNHISKLISIIPQENDYSLFQINTLKVELGNLKQFEEDIQKYILKQQSCSDDKAIISHDIQDNIDENESLNQLMCDQELEWGVKTRIKNPQPKVNQMYFSFQRNDSIIYENSDQHLSSPGFKQI